LTHFLMHEVEMKLIPVVADLEDNGYRIDRAHFEGLRERLQPEIDQCLGRIRQVAGEGFNPSSDPQVRILLYDQLKLKVTRRTKTGQPSVDKAVLLRAASRYEVAKDLIRYRQLDKILGTYTTLPGKVGEDGRLHASYNQLAARTGRFSSSSIIQTLPKSDEFQIRRGFIAEEGHQIVAADYDQQELRVLAQCSGDRHMQDAIRAGVDLHGLAAVKVFKLSCAPNEVKTKFKAERDRVKAIQFGLLYGASDFSLAGSLGIPREEARQLIADYFQQFPGVKRFIEVTHKRVIRDGYVEDLFGRRRYFPVAKEKPPRRKEWQQMSEAERALLRKINAAKREAQNFMIQGASATITKLAMIRCHAHIAAERPQIRMLVTVHDELQFEVPDDLVGPFAKDLPALMCDLGLERFGFRVPMQVEVKVGPSWGELKRWEGACDDERHAQDAAR
jgi:DNA polymerase-1